MTQARIMRSGALSHGESAFGHRFLKKGFSFSEQLDLAFALGFPSLTFVVDDHPDDADPLAKMHDWRVYHHAWLPAKIALYLVRDHAWSHSVIRGNDDAPWLTTKGEPLSGAEMRRLVPQCTDEMYSVLALYRWEALSSTDEVLSLVVEELERQVRDNDTAKLDDSNNVSVVEWAVPTMLGRVPADAREQHRARLAALYDRLAGMEDMRRAIDLALDRGSHNDKERWLIHGSVAPAQFVAWLEQRAIDESSYPDAREAFLGGDRAIEVMRKRWREYKAAAKERIVAQYGWVRSEQTVLLLLELLGGAPKLKGEVTMWLREHADYARPVLADLAKQAGPTGTLANKALGALEGAAQKKPPKKAARASKRR